MLNPKKINARDIMNEDVLTLNADTPVKEAVATLSEYRVTGAPVLNEAEECVGVFTRTDALRRKEEIEEGEAPAPGDYFGVDPELDADFEPGSTEYWPKSTYDPIMLGPETVGQWMTPDFKWVTPETPVDEVARRMAVEGIHRVLVMEGKRLRGIISAMDIVRLVASLEHEPRQGPSARSGR